MDSLRRLFQRPIPKTASNDEHRVKRPVRVPTDVLIDVLRFLPRLTTQRVCQQVDRHWLRAVGALGPHPFIVWKALNVMTGVPVRRNFRTLLQRTQTQISFCLSDNKYAIIPLDEYLEKLLGRIPNYLRAEKVTLIGPDEFHPRTLEALRDLRVLWAGYADVHLSLISAHPNIRSEIIDEIMISASIKFSLDFFYMDLWAIRPSLDWIFRSNSARHTSILAIDNIDFETDFSDGIIEWLMGDPDMWYTGEWPSCFGVYGPRQVRGRHFCTKYERGFDCEHESIKKLKSSMIQAFLKDRQKRAFTFVSTDSQDVTQSITSRYVNRWTGDRLDIIENDSGICFFRECDSPAIYIVE